MILGAIGIWILVIGGPIALLLAGVLLKAACDLCSVEPPPHFVRCLVVTVVRGLVFRTPVGYGARLVVGMLIASETISVISGCLLFLLIDAVISTPVFIITLRVRPLLGLKIWLIDALINLVVGAVVVLLFVGGWTTVESIGRLF